jgi:hypothetical protein
MPYLPAPSPASTKDIGWLDDGDFDQPSFWQRVKARDTKIVRCSSGGIGLFFIFAIVKRGNLHQQPLFILL